MQTLFSLFQSGGLFMWPILLLSIAAIAIVAERAVNLRLFSRNLNAIFDGDRSPRAGFSNLSSVAPGQEGSRVFEEIIQLAFDRQASGLELLSSIGNAAPLLGFLGTVSGMIFSFQSLAQADRVSVKVVAGGISEALITTGFGLVVAVICIISEQLLRQRLTALAHEAEERRTLLASLHVDQA